MIRQIVIRQAGKRLLDSERQSTARPTVIRQIVIRQEKGCWIVKEDSQTNSDQTNSDQTGKRLLGREKTEDRQTNSDQTDGDQTGRKKTAG